MLFSHHLRLFLALLSYVVEHVLQLCLLLVHLLQAVLGVLFLGLKFLKGGRLSVQIILHLLLIKHFKCLFQHTKDKSTNRFSKYLKKCERPLVSFQNIWINYTLKCNIESVKYYNRSIVLLVNHYPIPSTFKPYLNFCGFVSNGLFGFSDVLFQSVFLSKKNKTRQQSLATYHKNKPSFPPPSHTKTATHKQNRDSHKRALPERLPVCESKSTYAA